MGIISGAFSNFLHSMAERGSVPFPFMYGLLGGPDMKGTFMKHETDTTEVSLGTELPILSFTLHDCHSMYQVEHENIRSHLES